MVDNTASVAPIIRIATIEDIGLIEQLDGFSDSPTRHIHREVSKYFGSVDPSTHERILIFIAEIAASAAGKVELLLPPPESDNKLGYIQRVVVNPAFRKRGIAHALMQHVIAYARAELNLSALDLFVWEDNTPAIGLYESLGFKYRHRELYFSLPL